MTIGLARANTFPRLRHGGWATEKTDAYGWTPHGLVRHNSCEQPWEGMQGYRTGDRLQLELDFGKR